MRAREFIELLKHESAALSDTLPKVDQKPAEASKATVGGERSTSERVIPSGSGFHVY